MARSDGSSEESIHLDDDVMRRSMPPALLIIGSLTGQLYAKRIIEDPEPISVLAPIGDTTEGEASNFTSRKRRAAEDSDDDVMHRSVRQRVSEADVAPYLAPPCHRSAPVRMESMETYEYLMSPPTPEHERVSMSVDQPLSRQVDDDDDTDYFTSPFSPEQYDSSADQSPP